MTDTRRACLTLLTLLCLGPAGAEVFLLRGRDAQGRPLESRVELSAARDGSLRLERVTWSARGLETARGPAERRGDELRATLSPAGGLSARLGGAQLRIALRLSGERVQSRVRQDGALLAQEAGRRLPQPLDPARYACAPAGAATDAGAPVDLVRLNADPSALLRSLSPAERAAEGALLVVPGYAREDQTARLHPRAKARARLAARRLRRDGAQLILTSGGNVRPEGTGFNEAVELRRYLVRELGVPPWRVAVEPYARHTTTNLRNVGRFLLAHEVPGARVISSRDQSFYLGAARISSFHARCRQTLGYEVGRFLARSHRVTDFVPAPDVVREGPDPLDP